MPPRPPTPTLFPLHDALPISQPWTSRRAIRDRTVSRKPPSARTAAPVGRDDVLAELRRVVDEAAAGRGRLLLLAGEADRKSTRLNSSHPSISYAVFCLKKKK